MQLEAFLENAARRYPDKTALVCGARQLTYAELDRDCNRLAHALTALGVRRGDRVAVYLQNSAESVISIFAILKAGAVFLTVNPTTKPEKLTYVLKDSGARVLVAERQKLPSLHDCWQQLADLTQVITVGPPGQEDDVCPTPTVAWDALLARHQGFRSPRCGSPKSRPSSSPSPDPPSQSDGPKAPVIAEHHASLTRHSPQSLAQPHPKREG